MKEITVLRRGVEGMRVLRGDDLHVLLHRSIGQTLQGSFSAVSKPNFASKYAFESSRRDLHNICFAQLCNLDFSSTVLNFNLAKT